MKQAYMDAPGSIRYREIAIPVPGPGEVLMEVSKIGICGSDLHVFKGEHPLVDFPLVQGHEFSGYVRESKAEGFSPGDLVTVQPAVGCGECERCRLGLIAQCENLAFIGGGLPGAGSRFFVAPAAHIHRFSSGVTPEEAAMTEPLAVAVHAAGKLVHTEGAGVAITGGGTIGLLVAQVLRQRGAGRIIIVELREGRREKARRLGFETIEPPESADSLFAVLDGKKPDAAFECVGLAAPLNLCINAVRRGGEVIVLGVYPGPVHTDMLFVQDRELILRGSLMYTEEDFAEAVSLIERGAVELLPLVTHRLPFGKWIDAYGILTERGGEALKVMIDLDENRSETE